MPCLGDTEVALYEGTCSENLTAPANRHMSEPSSEWNLRSQLRLQITADLAFIFTVISRETKTEPPSHARPQIPDL